LISYKFCDMRFLNYHRVSWLVNDRFSPANAVLFVKALSKPNMPLNWVTIAIIDIRK